MKKQIIPPAYQLLSVSDLSWRHEIAGPADRIRYYRGSLAYDLSPDAEWQVPYERERLINVAALARATAEKGLVHLFQRRHRPGIYDYLIQKRAYREQSRSLLVGSAETDPSDTGTGQAMPRVAAAPEQLDMFRSVPS
jgi:hypothetical protein